MLDNIFIIACEKKKYFANCFDWAFLKYSNIMPKFCSECGAKMDKEFNI